MPCYLLYGFHNGQINVLNQKMWPHLMSVKLIYLSYILDRVDDISQGKSPQLNDRYYTTIKLVHPTGFEPACVRVET